MIGGFINSRTVALPDYNNIQGNQTDFATNYMDQFQIAPYYLYSNTDKFYFTGFAEHHFAGLLTNKIPPVQAPGLVPGGGRNNLLSFRRTDLYGNSSGIGKHL